MTPDEMQALVAQLGNDLSQLQGADRGTGPTVRKLFERYMDRHGAQSRTAAYMHQLFKNHLGCFAERRAGSLRAGEVNAWHAEIGARVGRHTANHALQILRATFNKAIRWESFNGLNPCRTTSEFSLESRDRYLSKTEVEKLLAALQTMRSATFRNLILTCLYTAARRGNVQSMRWEDIDPDRAVWRIPMTKSGKPVFLPLIPEAMAAIAGQRGKHEVWVFPGYGKSGHMANPQEQWGILCKKAGIENLHMHDLRRTMASWQANTGASLQVIQKSLGHSNINATQIYARLQIAPVRESMEKAAKAMRA